ncbi:MAG: phosphohistidine phosphatase SixA [Thermodesulfobacteriota bacterium]
MKLYLVQHGEAKPEAEDPERSLSVKGEDETRKISIAGKKLNLRPSKVYHSGKLRATQTAKILAEGLNIPASSVLFAQGLNPNDDVRPWAKRISEETEDLMLVGHLPFLEKLVSLLLCGNEDLRIVLFRYSGIVCLEKKEDKKWAIRWVLLPEMV